MLYIPRYGPSAIEDNTANTANELGVSVASGGSANTKNTTYTELLSSTAKDSYGITVFICNTGVASTANSVLVDIAIGAASSEVVIIPNLIAGSAGTWSGAQSFGHAYHFPIRIPAGTRLSATAQDAVGGDTANVGIILHQYPIPGKWYGSRVTAYGANTAASTGTSTTPGNGVYGSDATLSASTTYPIKYLQVGGDLLGDDTAATSRGLIQLSADSVVLATDLITNESTTLENVYFWAANFVLSHMQFNIPAGKTLTIAHMRNTGAENRGWAAYGVD